MKLTVYDIKGKKKGEVSLPSVFNGKIREDLAAKYFEVDKLPQPYSPSPTAGRRHSASGTISHQRHDWKGHYGKGISRVPRKTMWRRGTQFMWIGAEVSGMRGGRKVHGPSGIGKEKKMNKKEISIAMSSAIAATANQDYILKRYSSLNKLEVKFPIVIESKENVKAKEFKNMISEILGEKADMAFRNKEVRAGKGKLRGRKYKSNAGLLLIKGNNEKLKVNGLEVVSVKDISIRQLYPLGRMAAYTEKAIEEIGGKIK